MHELSRPARKAEKATAVTCVALLATEARKICWNYNMKDARGPRPAQPAVARRCRKRRQKLLNFMNKSIDPLKNVQLSWSRAFRNCLFQPPS